MPFAESADMPFGIGHQVAPFVRVLQATAAAALVLGRIDGSDVVADLGCGDGAALLFFQAQCGYRGRGMDILVEEVERARAKAPDGLFFDVGDVFVASLENS